MKRQEKEILRFTPVPGVDFVDPKTGEPAQAHTCYIIVTKYTDGSVRTRNITEKADGHFETVDDWYDFLNRAQLSYIIEPMSVLHLVLKHEWYHAIEHKGKREEYRNPYEYWTNRLTNNTHRDVVDLIYGWRKEPLDFKHYDFVVFHDGYTSITQTWKVTGIDFGQGRQKWGAPDNKTFIIKFAERIQ